MAMRAPAAHGALLPMHAPDIKNQQIQGAIRQAAPRAPLKVLTAVAPPCSGGGSPALPGFRFARWRKTPEPTDFRQPNQIFSTFIP